MWLIYGSIFTVSVEVGFKMSLIEKMIEIVKINLLLILLYLLWWYTRPTDTWYLHTKWNRSKWICTIFFVASLVFRKEGENNRGCTNRSNWFNHYHKDKNEVYFWHTYAIFLFYARILHKQLANSVNFWTIRFV